MAIRTAAVPVNIHELIRAELVEALGECAPSGCGEGACYQHGFCGGETVVPTGACCDVLVVSPGSLRQVMPGRDTKCWRRWSQLITIRLMMSWPVDVECQNEKVATALWKLNDCGQSLLCALANLKIPGLGNFAGQCSPVDWDGELRCIAPEGGCAGWTAQLRVGR